MNKYEVKGSMTESLEGLIILHHLAEYNEGYKAFRNVLPAPY